MKSHEGAHMGASHLETARTGHRSAWDARDFFQGIAKCVQIRRSSDWRSNEAADRSKKNQGGADMEASQHGSARPGFGRAWDARELFKRGEGVGVKYPEVNPTAKNEDSRGGSERTNL